MILAALFAGAMVWLVSASLASRQVPTFAPRLPAPHDSLAVDTATIDTRDPDQWRFFALGNGLLAPPDTAGWDLAARRFHVIVAGRAARVDTIDFDALVHAPPMADGEGAGGGFVATTFARDTVNPVLARWYRYSMFSHLLQPRQAVYVIRTPTGRYAKLEFLSYYCPGPEPGCLTFRYALLR